LFLLNRGGWIRQNINGTSRLKTIVFVGASQQDMHGEYADKQLENLQKRICLIEFLRLDLIVVYQGRARYHFNRYGFPATGTYNVPREGIHRGGLIQKIA